MTVRQIFKIYDSTASPACLLTQPCKKKHQSEDTKVKPREKERKNLTLEAGVSSLILSTFFPHLRASGLFSHRYWVTNVAKRVYHRLIQVGFTFP